jgi:hypothetical protein
MPRPVFSLISGTLARGQRLVEARLQQLQPLAQRAGPGRLRSRAGPWFGQQPCHSASGTPREPEQEQQKLQHMNTSRIFSIVARLSQRG